MPLTPHPRKVFNPGMTSVEAVQKAIEELDCSHRPAILLDREWGVHTNEKARRLLGFQPTTWQDLPEKMTEGLDAALKIGCRSFFCSQVNGGPSWRIKARPEYLDSMQRDKPTCAVLRLEEKTCKSVPEFIATPLYRELNEGCLPMSTLSDASLAERYQGDPDFFSGQKRAGEFLFAHTLRVAEILLALIGGYGGAKQPMSVGSLMAEADQARLKLHQRPLDLALRGPDGLVFSSGNLRRLRILFTELLTELRIWSESATIHWAEDGDRLGVPAAKIGIGFENWPHSISYLESKNQGLGLDVAGEIVLDAGGRMEVNPGKPASLCLWLPLTLPECF
jgi:hypothetical protein